MEKGSKIFQMEKKWQKYWNENDIYKVDLDRNENKLYCLVMFIYPSGDKLHIGHWYNYAPTDTWGRFKKLQGFNVFEPMGYDAFGLPAENYAIKKGVHPAESTEENIKYIREQLREMGCMYDFEKEVDTSKPEYYKWTQWLFIQLYKKGLAYKGKGYVNWCPQCKTVLANEQVQDGVCERCDSEVTKKELEQWYFKITEYAEELLEYLDKIDWPHKTKVMQKNWIGKSVGAEINFSLEEKNEDIKVFTTRPDTLMGVTYMVLAPEHELVEKLTTEENSKAVKEYKKKSASMTEIERLSTENEKTGVFLGSYALHPITGERVPIWISDYVLVTYGTGAVMAVPAHDTRDYEFAQKFDLPVKQVIKPLDNAEVEENQAYTDYGVMINSGEFDGLKSQEGMNAVINKLKSIGKGDSSINYRLRDWLISRQRYWGAPIPMVNCEKCGIVPVPEKELPIKLPDMVDFAPKDALAPLGTSEEYVNTKCPKCGGDAKREIETMDTFVCSSWYYLRYLSPDLNDKPFSKEKIDKWMPVDKYVGGAEHACMHLLYARFVTKALRDMGYIDFDEPFLSLRHQGTITNEGAKMSKSKGNVVNPDEFVHKYGSDVFRSYMMFMGSYEEGGDWSDTGIVGMERFYNRYKRLIEENIEGIKQVDDEAEFSIKNLTDEFDKKIFHKFNWALDKITNDIENFSFNTAIAASMELVNELYKFPVKHDLFYFILKKLIVVMSPFMPHLAEELYSKTESEKISVFKEKWPKIEKAALILDNVTVAVQINGKLRETIEAEKGISKEKILKIVYKLDKIKKYTDGKKIIKEIFVPDRIVNIVVK